MDSNALNVMEVWKYPLEVTDEQKVEVPYGSKVLSVIEQNDMPTLYALVNPYSNLKETWCISIRGTGHPLAKEMLGVSLFIGTISTHSGRLVWHIWSRKYYEGDY